MNFYFHFVFCGIINCLSTLRYYSEEQNTSFWLLGNCNSVLLEILFNLNEGKIFSSPNIVNILGFSQINNTFKMIYYMTIETIQDRKSINNPCHHGKVLKICLT